MAKKRTDKQEPKLPNVNRRGWLNKHGYQTIAMYQLTMDSWNTGANGYTHNIDLTLGDCSRQIHLDFNCYNKGVTKNNLYKVRKIRKQLDAIEKRIEEVMEIKGWK